MNTPQTGNPEEIIDYDEELALERAALREGHRYDNHTME